MEMKSTLRIGDIIQYTAGINICVGRVIKMTEYDFTYTVYEVNGQSYEPITHSTRYEEAHSFKILPPTPEYTEARETMKRWKDL